MWPTGLGFEYFFGFMAAETNQFTPALYRGITPVPTLEEGVLDKALADDAIHWLHQQQAAAPGKPFFMYYATGTAHAPLQAPADWIARFKGKFAGGYDRMREEVVERQKRMGLVPADTVNTPRPEEIAAWDALTPEQKKINERFMEVYAAMLAYQDEQVGRLFAEIERMGLRDNTLVIFIEGDNGAAAEGGMHGSMNPMSNFANGTQESEATLLANLERIGGPEAVAQYGYGWTWATNAPFRLAKQYASHLGGTRNGMVVSWPQRIKSGGMRQQFSHVTDIAPTIYEAAGVTAPDTVNGVEQQPMDGSSLLYAFDKADAPERHDTQYFEMMGNQAIYHQGWLASTTPAIAPWARDRRNDTLPSQYPWELYDLREDFSQAHDLASAHPEKLAQMKALFLEEARRNQVLPLDNRLSMERFLAASSQHRKADRYTYWGAGVSVPAVSAAPILNRSFTISAELDAPEQAQGVVLALGSMFGGWSFFVQDGTPVAVMAASQLEGDQSRVAAATGCRRGNRC
jgi:arylsulfatase A-like enzyme